MITSTTERWYWPSQVNSISRRHPKPAPSRPGHTRRPRPGRANVSCSTWRTVTFLASVGLELLADHRSRAARTGVTIALATTTRAVTRVHDVGGLSPHFPICADLDTALAT
ncbi:STAS domain-containing protein [Amycolatopsis sp. NBRC 101858]|uniref:STAS domain-containing protein n=1 Tax=Amycolatopsis sp. NBRC 101858 TaxID=3032200 RepID=UPI00333A4D86